MERTADADGITVDSTGILRCGGQRIEGIELMEEPPPGGGLVKAKLTYPIVTDDEGKIDGIDMTLVENRKRLHNESTGIANEDEKELEGRMSNQPQHKVFLFDQHKKQGKRWKHQGKVRVPLDPNRTSDSPEFPPGSVLSRRSESYED